MARKLAASLVCVEHARSVANAHTGNRARVTSMGGLYDATTLCVRADCEAGGAQTHAAGGPGNAHTGNRTLVTSMEGLYDTTTLCVLLQLSVFGARGFPPHTHRLTHARAGHSADRP